MTLIYHLINDYNDTHDEKRKKQKKYTDYIRSSHSGFIRGVIMGCVMGDFGITTAIMNGAVFGIINPTMMYMGY